MRKRYSSPAQRHRGDREAQHLAWSGTMVEHYDPAKSVSVIPSAETSVRGPHGAESG